MGRIALKLLLVIAAVLPATSRALNLVRLTPDAPSAAPGDPIRLVLEMAFDEPTLGGGLEIRFDPGVFGFDRFVFDAGLGDSPALRLAPVDGASGSSLVIAFGALEGLGGSRTVGALHFTRTSWRLPIGTTREIDVVPNLAPAGPFVSALDFQALDVGWSGATFVLVPEPGSATLLCVGAIALTARRRRCRATR